MKIVFKQLWTADMEKYGEQVFSANKLKLPEWG